MSETATKHNIMAAVDIGSYSIKMKIADVDSEGGIQTLETPKKFINLGKDTFITGKINNEHLEEICSILKNFKKLINEYKADKYMIVATSALREAVNCDYVLDYVYQKTGFKIDVISESEERFFTYGSITDNLKDFHKLKQEGILITDVGSGGVEITLFYKGDLVFTQYVRMGALRLKEVLSTLERRTLNFPNLIGEYIESEIDTIKVQLQQNPIHNYLIIGSEIHVMHDILASGRKEYNRAYMPREAFYKIFHKVIGKSLQQIAREHLLKSESVETLVPAMLMYEKFLSFTSTDRVYTPAVSLCDGLLRYMTDTKFDLENKIFSEKDIIISVRKLAEKYSYDSKHAEQVEMAALLLFDNSKRLHGYSDKERLFLQIAAIAHDTGKYINIKSHNVLSHIIIQNSDILGLSKNDLNIIANITRYHSNNIPDMEDSLYKSLDYDSRIMVSKLAAFLKIADALDRSHKQKLSDIKIVSGEQTLTIKAQTDRDSLLEEWEFENKRNLFKEVYGFYPNLIIKRK